MKTSNSIGIWMDHHNANLIEFTTEPMTTKVLSSKFTHEAKEETIKKSEQLMHNKEQHQQQEYYKQISKVIRNYTDVVLFGPTDAKLELYNTIKDDHDYDAIKIRIIQADKMTDNQQHAFVREHFQR